MTTKDNKYWAQTETNFYCNLCDVVSSCKSNFIKHCETQKHKKHKMTTKDNKNCAKLGEKYWCSICDYKTNKKSCFDAHNISNKHTKNIVAKDDTEYQDKPTQYICQNCDRDFADRICLWRHKGKCLNKYNDKQTDKQTDNALSLISQNTLITPELVIELIKNNTELKNVIIEQNTTINNLVKNGITNTNINNSNNTNNSHNKTFNLQLFLNETCKDAMNIKDFVDSMDIPFNDFVRVGDIGYVEGLSNIIVKSLNNLDITKRPIHCTDKKREILYVKDDGVWEKEDKNNSKLRLMVKHVAHKNAKMLLNFREKHPDCNKSNSKFSDQYTKLTIETMGGSGDNDIEKEDKIIKNISKIVTIDKLGIF